MNKYAKEIMVALTIAGSFFSLTSCKNQNDNNLPILNTNTLNSLPDDFSDEIIVEGDIVSIIKNTGSSFHSFDLMNIDFMTKNNEYYVLLNGEMITSYESGRQEGLVVFEISEKIYNSYKDRLKINRFYFGNEDNKEIIGNESYACLRYDVYLLGKILRDVDTKLSLVKNIQNGKVVYDCKSANESLLIEL